MQQESARVKRAAGAVIDEERTAPIGDADPLAVADVAERPRDATGEQHAERL